MKKKKILFGAIIIAALLGTNTSIYAAGLDVSDQNKQNTINDTATKTTEKEINLQIDYDGFALYSLWTADKSQQNEYYYDQLPEIEKYIYDCINENIDSIIASNNPFNIDTSDFNILYSQITGGELNWSKPIFTYFDFDHPEKFGINYSNLGLSISGIPVDNNDYKITQLGIYFGGSNVTSPLLGYTSSQEINTDLKAMEKNITEIINSIPKYSSRYKKIQIINNWLVKHNTYNPYVYKNDTDSASSTAWEITSALVYTDDTSDDTKYPVCEGYANAFKYLCDRVNIPCVSVESDTHKWNLVQLEDGKWYQIDVTWNDPVGATNDSYINRYFLLGSSNSLMTDTDHTINMTNPEISAPEISTTDYSYKNAHNGDVNQDYLVDYKDVALILKHISGKEKIQASKIGSGDINNDNVMDLKDAIAILNLINSQ